MARLNFFKLASSRKTLLVLVALTALAATACGSSGSLTPDSPVAGPTSAAPAELSPGTTSEPSAVRTPTSQPQPTATPGPGLDTEVFEELNPRPELRAIDRSIDFGFDEQETLPRDAINPVYSPKFASPEEVAELMIEDELVMGLNVDGDARAYPVGIMRFREMVNDVVGGVPLLVTW